MSATSTVLLSLHPRHAEKIVSGEKRLEFRRVWAKSPVSTVVIYATAPVQRIVAVADVSEVHQGSPSRLWRLAKHIGGGLPRREIYAYFKGRKTGYAVELAHVRQCDPALDPSQFIDNFRPPQSFQYLCPAQRDSILQAMPDRDPGHVIFVAGIHGVGKTTLCAALAGTEGVVHKSAGQIIREADAAALSDSTKAVGDIDYTQHLLAHGVDRIRQEHRDLLLDGHFALVNGSGQVESIAKEVFEALTLDGIVLVHDSPREVYERLIARDDNSFTLATLTELESVEAGTAEAIAKALEIPLVRVKAEDQGGFEKACAVIRSQIANSKRCHEVVS